MKKSVRATISQPSQRLCCLFRADLAVLPPQSDLAFGIQRVSYSVTLGLHEELAALEASLPVSYQLPRDDQGDIISPVIAAPGHNPAAEGKAYSSRPMDDFNAGIIGVTLAAAFVRCHRPWLGASRIARDLSAGRR
jgi:hypothetical protein